jgi:acetyl esterase
MRRVMTATVLVAVSAWLCCAIGDALGRDVQAAGTVKEFVYREAPQCELKVLVHYPPDWKETDKRPAIIFFFGGSWTNGSPAQFEPQAKYLATRGLVAVRAEYRIKSKFPEITPKDCVEDAQCAMRWMRKNAGKLGVDPEKIIASGGSAGGHLAACTGCCPPLEVAGEDLSLSCKPCAMVLFNPVLDFTVLDDLRSRVGNDEQVAKAISPTHFLVNDSPPAILFYGTEDSLLLQGKAFMKRSKEVGHKTELYLAEGMGHGFINRPPWQNRTLLRADEFLTSLGYLTGRPTLKAE